MEGVEQTSGEGFRLVRRGEGGGDLVVRRVSLQDGLSRDLGGDIPKGTIRMLLQVRLRKR